MLTDEEIRQRIAPFCDEETTDEERVMLASAARLGDALDEAHRMADALMQHLRRLHHDYWQTPSEPMLLNLYIDARWLRDNINGWQDYDGPKPLESTGAP